MKKIAFITDLHLSERLPIEVDTHAHWKIVHANLSESKPDKIIFGGDLGECREYALLTTDMAPWPDVNVLAGNHDDVRALRALREADFAHPTHLFRSEVNEGFLWLFLDSSQGHIGTSQMQWIREQLRECGLPALVFIHHPILEINHEVDRKYAVFNRDELRELLLQYDRPVAIFCGHCHADYYAECGKISQLTTPAVSYQIHAQKNFIDPYRNIFGYRIIELHEQGWHSYLQLFTETP